MIRRTGITRWLVRVGILLFLAVVVIAIFVSIISRGTKSEDMEMYEMVKKLLPSGNCHCQSSTNFECGACLDCANGNAWSMGQKEAELDDQEHWKFTFGRDDKNEGLNEAQCAASFPGLFEDIRRAADLRRNDPITLEELDAVKIRNGDSRGIVRAKIYDGEVCQLSQSYASWFSIAADHLSFLFRKHLKLNSKLALRPCLQIL
jgi:hypothetical protein